MKAAIWTVAGLLAAVGVAWNCGPFLPVAVFSYARHPDLPRTRFLQGDLGVLRPAYAQSYLVVAYRYMSGVGLTAREREGVRDYWRDRATGRADHDETDWYRNWTDLVGRVNGGQPAPKTAETTGEAPLAYQPRLHSWVINCAEDAFKTAVRTYESRSRQFGAQSQGVRSWMVAQQKVFENCEMEDSVMPAPAEAELPEVFKQDRAYQIAAAHLYAGHAQAAIQGFKSIAADAASPWSEISAYLAVRARLRGAESEGDLAKVRDESLGILNEPKLVRIHGMTRTLLRRADVGAKRAETFREMARSLAGPNEDGSIREDLWDYTGMFDTLAGTPEAEEEDLTDWIHTFQQDTPQATLHAWARWRERKSLPWLVAALEKANSRDAGIQQLMEDARGVSPKSPAFVTVAYHRLRLSVAAGQKAQSRAELDGLLAGRPVKLPASARNLFQPLRMTVAPTLDEFFLFVARVPVLETDNMDDAEWPREAPKRLNPLIDTGGANALNEAVPLRHWATALQGQRLPGEMRKRLVLTMFARAAFASQWKELDSAASLLEGVRPDLKDLLAGVQAAHDEREKKFAAAFLLLHTPEAKTYARAGSERTAQDRRLDNYRDNWWCPDAADYQAGNFLLRDRFSEYASPEERKGPPQPRWIAPAFLSAADLQQAAEERARLRTAGSALKALGSTAVEWAKSHKEDPRVPEALALTVRAARYGCSDKDDWKVTRAAFQFLHLNFGRSEWARKTPIWVQY
ncbi:hypothetical protein [Paludibaculum fermentans]|uniref:Uncharacterized protein n=1 Tax=Paludibaculum fermentans TaxID=1473598 RepID=A0A7S7NY70_PALFE|nr:hypothetical protein [Paludibaculum fermentans]QOY91379.1 hypothetical protein IRI77_15940 [Paludibaculum fermentans]